MLFRSGLDGVAACDAGEAAGDLLKLLKALDVVFDVLAPGAGAGGGDGVRGLYEAGDDGVGLHIAVVGLDGVQDLGGFLVLAGDVHADGDVAALDLVVDALAEVVQQAGALGGGDVHAELGGQETSDVGDLDGVVEDVLPVAGAVLLAAQELDELRVEVVDARLVRGALALLLDRKSVV